MDWETLGESIRKTNRVLVVEQGSLGTSWGAWLVDELQRRFFDWLDHPIERVTGAESAPTISKVLEQAALADTDDVVEGLRRVLALQAGGDRTERTTDAARAEAEGRLRAVAR
jgi:2-oxoisovalerate dehydrogenase E1 component